MSDSWSVKIIGAQIEFSSGKLTRKELLVMLAGCPVCGVDELQATISASVIDFECARGDTFSMDRDQNMSTPYIGFDNRTLAGQPNVKQGDLIDCPHCGDKHPIGGAEDNSAGIMFYKCGETDCLASIDGKLVAGLKPDVSSLHHLP